MQAVCGSVVNEVWSRLREVPNVVVGAPLRLAMNTIGTLGGTFAAAGSCCTLGLYPALNEYADFTGDFSSRLLRDPYQSLLYLANPAAGTRLTNYFAQLNELDAFFKESFSTSNSQELSKEDFKIKLNNFSNSAFFLRLDSQSDSLPTATMKSIDQWKEWAKGHIGQKLVIPISRASVLGEMSNSTWLGSMTSEALFNLGLGLAQKEVEDWEKASWEEIGIVVLSNQVASRLAFVASAIATLVVKPFDLLTGIVAAGLSLGSFGLVPSINRFAMRQLGGCAGLSDFCNGLRYALNPYQASGDEKKAVETDVDVSGSDDESGSDDDVDVE